MKGRWAAPLRCHIFWVAGLPLLMLSFSARGLEFGSLSQVMVISTINNLGGVM